MICSLEVLTLVIRNSFLEDAYDTVSLRLTIVDAGAQKLEIQED